MTPHTYSGAGSSNDALSNSSTNDDNIEVSRGDLHAITEIALKITSLTHTLSR